MKKFITVIILLCLIVTTTFAQTKDEKQLATAVETLKKAMLDANRQMLDDIAAPELSYGHSSGKMENKMEFIDALVSGRSDFITMDLSNQSIKVIGKTAIVRHNLNGTTTDSGVPGAPKLGVLLVWQKMNGKWKLLARQAFKL